MEEGRPRILLASISGIVGCGKTTAIKRLRKSGLLKSALPPNVHLTFVREPSRLWRERGWLRAFYANPSHNAAAFQFQAFATYVDAVENALRDDPCPPGCDVHVIIAERSMYDQRLFWVKQCSAGMATADTNYDEAYTLIWQRWRRFIPEVDLIFYFQTHDINTTMRRVQARARAEEMGASFSSAEDQGTDSDAQPQVVEQVGGLTLAYQLELQRLHREWYTTPRARPLGCPNVEQGIHCIHVDADAPYHADDGTLQGLAQLLAFHIMEQLGRH